MDFRTRRTENIYNRIHCMKNTLTISIATLVGVLLSDTRHIVAQSVTPVPNMIWINSGTFVMGSPLNEEGHTIYEEQQTRVTLTYGFYMNKFEATQQEYLDLTGLNPSTTTNLDAPVTKTSWNGAVNYCFLLTERERSAGRIPSNWEYRLPTDAEWEYCCRAGTTTRYSFGDDPTYTLINQYEWYIGNTGTNGLFPRSVGIKLPNRWGLYDMQGNVSEYALDWFIDNPFRGSLPGGSLVDSHGPTTGVWRVFRGGSFFEGVSSCRAAVRGGISPTSTSGLIGFRVVLAPATPEWRQVIETQLERPKYSSGPVKEVGKSKLVLVTHGWIPSWDIPQLSTAWVDEMTNSIDRYLTDKGLDGWQVVGYKWIEGAHPLDLLSIAFPTRAAQTALENAKREGRKLGEYLAGQGWSEIHFIAHSAGSGLIQAATEAIKDISPSTIVHVTFLDPFVGLDYSGVSSYGNRADWAENYYSRDLDTGGENWPFTQGLFDYCYNIEVTWVDDNKILGPVYISTPLGTQRCTQTVSSHGWPIQFYQNTIPPNTQLGSAGFGFPLSRAGGNWDYAISNYMVSPNALWVLGTPDDPQCNQLYTSTPPMIGERVDFSNSPIEKSSTGEVKIHGIDSFSLITGSPVWLAAVINPTNSVNLVSFDAKFVNANGSEGLLSLYWDTNSIGSVDEPAIQLGFKRYAFMFPRAASNTLHILGFRLDAFTNVPSSVLVTNVSLVSMGVSEPFTLSFAGVYTNMLPIFELTGPTGVVYTIETSSNLVDWTTSVVLVNNSGKVRFSDLASTNALQRFYRAVAP